MKHLFQPLKHDEQYGHDEEQRERSDYHPADGADGQRTGTVGTDARRENHREQSENHRQRGHQNGTQAGFGSRQCG